MGNGNVAKHFNLEPHLPNEYDDCAYGRRFMSLSHPLSNRSAKNIQQYHISQEFWMNDKRRKKLSLNFMKIKQK